MMQMTKDELAAARLAAARNAEAAIGRAEAKMAEQRIAAQDRWSHKNEGTPQTHEHASRVNQGALARMFMSGAITADQLAWAVEIGEAAESIERDVAVRIVSYEPRIDRAGSARDVLVEGIKRVRREVAYSWWRTRIPSPQRAVLDMLVGEPKAFSSVARQYRIHKRKARRILIDAIDMWPEAQDYAAGEVDAASLAAAHAGLV